MKFRVQGFVEVWYETELEMDKNKFLELTETERLNIIQPLVKDQLPADGYYDFSTVIYIDGERIW